MNSVRSALARLSVSVGREDGIDPKQLEKDAEVTESVSGLFRIMREEMSLESSAPAS